MKRFIKVLAIVFCLSMLMSCGNIKNTVHDDVQESQDTENTVNTISNNTEDSTEAETVIEETETPSKGSKDNPYKLGETITLSMFARFDNGDIIPATMDVLLEPYNDEFIKCNISNIRYESDKAINLSYTLLSSIVNESFTEVSSYFLLSEPDLLSEFDLNVYSGGDLNVFIDISQNKTESPIKYVILKYSYWDGKSDSDENASMAEIWIDLTEL